jgi:hypothetical protein
MEPIFASTQYLLPVPRDTPPTPRLSEARETMLAVTEKRQVPGRSVCESWLDSHQIDDREQPNPDDVERVPEQGKAPVPRTRLETPAKAHRDEVYAIS